MSDTPMTDRARSECRSLEDLFGCQPLERVARKMERELAAVTAERDALQDKMADYDRRMLARFDAHAAESTDLFTWIECLRTERDAAVQWIRVVGEELVLAGFPSGDRTTILVNLRAIVSERDALLKALRRACIALAHAAESDPRYSSDYKAVSDAIVASKEKL